MLDREFYRKSFSEIMLQSQNLSLNLKKAAAMGD